MVHTNKKRRVPDSDWRVNKLLETELVFDCDEVAAEMHISLVRYEQEIYDKMTYLPKNMILVCVYI